MAATASSTRGPLSSATNNSNSPPPSPPSSIAKVPLTISDHQRRTDHAYDVPSLRRKATTQNLHLDSSETLPSPHNSLYEASIVEVAPAFHGNEDSWVHQKAKVEQPLWANMVCDSTGNPVPASFLQPSPSRHTHEPHKLYPITEQNSLATLQPSLRSRSSLKDRTSSLTLRSRRSRSPGLNGMKRKSFSFADLPRLPDADLLPESVPSPPATIRVVPGPNQPFHPQPVRSQTPPNIPSFGTPGAINYRLPAPPELADKKRKTRFSQRFRSPTAEVQQWRRQTVGLPKGVAMRGDDGTMVRGKFTPTQSGHNGPVRRGNVGSSNAAPSVVIPTDRSLMPDNSYTRSRTLESSDHGMHADWTNAVMSGGIGAGPEPEPQVRVVGLQEQVNEISGEKHKPRTECFRKWAAFFGSRAQGAVTSQGSMGYCMCSKRIWSCCPCLDGPDGEPNARSILLPGRG